MERDRLRKESYWERDIRGKRQTGKETEGERDGQ